MANEFRNGDTQCYYFEVAILPKNINESPPNRDSMEIDMPVLLSKPVVNIRDTIASKIAINIPHTPTM